MFMYDIGTSIMKYIVLNRSPANQVNIITKLSPFTLFVRQFENICGKPSVAYMDIDRNPSAGPNIGIYTN